MIEFLCRTYTSFAHEHTVHLLLGFHIHNEVVVRHHVKRVVRHFINFQAFQFVRRHVVECDVHVSFEKRVAIKPDFLDVTSEIRQLAIHVFQSGHPAHEIEQHASCRHLIRRGVKYRGVTPLVHSFQFRYHFRLGKCHGVALQHDGIKAHRVFVNPVFLRLNRGYHLVIGLHADIRYCHMQACVLQSFAQSDPNVESAVSLDSVTVHIGRIAYARDLYVSSLQRIGLRFEIVNAIYLAAYLIYLLKQRPHHGFLLWGIKILRFNAYWHQKQWNQKNC